MSSLTTGKVIACLAIMFAAGGTAGAVLTWRNTHARESKPASMEKVCHSVQDRLKSKLALTEDQVRKLQPIFDNTAREIAGIHAKAICETDNIIRKAHEEMAKELTPEQQTKLQAFDQERRAWVKRHIKEKDLPPPAKSVPTQP